ncbi:hypothetical protein [Microbacterium imperiale]|uniref:Uncharacterized protein n=1 Tax=Microbacterium imperiale TaxID=33884 RepID=A0A9W6HDL8_9MICO|nr:hypothetical protein [Microbacterium imperiale]MBP2420137.1 hypothetical protein [Microbacterium imperiale]MDS0198000.1 hypothetical protein [Microbacterium imperiale]BFE40478.1 hypothetical protein GCM10017544_14340 [Microbacterium imperiale]GLJ78546.1 hypothetical protein GCM10017586_02280 [Microbacterium imperiale]
MSIQWTLDDPGAGVPAEIRAEAGRRDTMSRLAQSAAGNTTSAAPTGEWQGEAASALTGKTAQFSAELHVLRDHAAIHAGILRRYAAEVEAIKAEYAVVASSYQQAAHNLARTQRQHDAVAMFVDGTIVDEKARLASRINNLEADMAGLNARLRNLADRRAAADNTAIMALTSPEARGGLSGILANSVGLPGSAAASGRTPSLEQLAELSEIELAILFALQPGLARQLQSESQPADVAAWWGTLTTDQQTAFVLGAPALIGSLGGITPGSRVAANLVNAHHRREAIGAELARLEAIAAEPRAPYAIPKYLLSAEEYTALRKEATYLDRVLQGKVQLYLYDPDNFSIIEMIGTLGPNTTSVTTYVPGTFTSKFSFFDTETGVTQVGRWMERKDSNMVTFVWKEGIFPGEDPNAGSVNLSRIGEANDEERALETGELLARFQDEIAASSSHVANAESIARGHSWGLAGITASEVAGAHYDQVHSLAGAGMPAGWEEDRETAYFHWSYVDALSMAQSTSLVWGGNIPSTHPAFQSTIYERDGDFDLYLPGPDQALSPNPPPSIPATTDPLGNHDLIAQQEGNQKALRDMYLATEAERKR